MLPLLLLLLLPASCSASAWSAYKKLAKSDVPYATMGRRSSAAEAAAACAALPGCAAYNSDGELKSCAGCEGGSDCCVYPAGATDFPAADRLDLFVKQGLAPPAAWAAGMAEGSLLYAQPEPDLCMMPGAGLQNSGRGSICAIARPGPETKVHNPSPQVPAPKHTTACVYKRTPQ